MLLDNVTKAIKQTGAQKIAIAGGVSANSFIRKAFLNLENEYKDFKVYMPDMKLCTDNGGMIASAGYYNYFAGNIHELELYAMPNLKI